MSFIPGFYLWIWWFQNASDPSDENVIGWSKSFVNGENDFKGNLKDHNSQNSLQLEFNSKDRVQSAQQKFNLIWMIQNFISTNGNSWNC